MAQLVVPARSRRLRSPWWGWGPLAGSVVALIPALPISLLLSLVALLAVLLTDDSAPHRRLTLRLVVGWIALQAIVMLVGGALWSSFHLTLPKPLRYDQRHRHPESKETSSAEKTTYLLILTSASILWAGSPTSHGYTTTGCRWGTKSPTISTRNVHGTYNSALYSARSNINARTPVTLNTTYEGALWWAWDGSYGSSGWEGISSWSCRSGKVTGANSRVNETYLAGAPSGQIKVVWLHELSHVFGLGHVNSKKRVMYTSASEAYRNGVRSLTSDEIAGYRNLY